MQPDSSDVSKAEGQDTTQNFIATCAGTDAVLLKRAVVPMWWVDCYLNSELKKTVVHGPQIPAVPLSLLISILHVLSVFEKRDATEAEITVAIDSKDSAAHLKHAKVLEQYFSTPYQIESEHFGDEKTSVHAIKRLQLSSNPTSLTCRFVFQKQR